MEWKKGGVFQKQIRGIQTMRLLSANVAKNGYEPLYINSKLFPSLNFISTAIQFFRNKKPR